MQDEFLKLLEKIDTVPLGQRLTVCEVINEEDVSNQSIVVERRNLINEAFKRELIGDADNPSKHQDFTTVPDNIPCYLTIAGFELLNQIKIKKAIEQLDVSIRRFNESSDKSSKIIEQYNANLVNLTLLLVVLTIALLIIPPEAPSLERYVGIIIIVGFTIIFFPLKKNH